MGRFKLFFILLACLILPIPAVATGDWFTMAAGSGDSAGGCTANLYTNSVLYSRDIPSGITATNWSQGGTDVAAYNAVGLDGDANTASTLTDDSASGQDYVIQQFSIPNDSNYNTVRFFIKKDSDTARFPSVRLRQYFGTPTDRKIQINTQAGTTTTVAETDGSDEVNSWDDSWWEVLLSVQNNTSGATSAQIYIWPASGSVWGSADNTATGTAIIGNVEFYKGKAIAEIRGLCPAYHP
jgi:hypothetical protein